jgi:hypothetical protein
MSEKQFSPNGSTHISELIRTAVENGSRTATVTGNWEIETEVRIPSDFTLILDGCHLKMADGVYSNLFVNQHHNTDIGRTVQGTDRNINILGRNGAILDGGTYNGLSERTQLTNGLPPIWKNNLLLFTNVDGFEMRDFTCQNQRWWAMNFLFCCNGTLKNLHFHSNDTAIDENGNVYHGLIHNRYGDVLVKNSDGIDLRQGCHHITIENITGFTQDDTVAVTGLRGELERMYCVENADDDIYNISIRNVMVSAFCAKVRLLNQSGVRMYNILVDGVFDTSKGNPHMQSGGSGVRLGDNHMYGTRHATEDETKNITVQNVHSRAEFALRLAGKMSACCFRNISHFDDPALCVDDQANVDTTSFFQA